MVIPWWYRVWWKAAEDYANSLDPEVQRRKHELSCKVYGIDPETGMRCQPTATEEEIAELNQMVADEANHMMEFISDRTNAAAVAVETAAHQGAAAFAAATQQAATAVNTAADRIPPARPSSPTGAP